MASKTIKAIRPNKTASIPDLRDRRLTRGVYAPTSLRSIGVPLTVSTKTKSFTTCIYARPAGRASGKTDLFKTNLSSIIEFMISKQLKLERKGTCRLHPVRKSLGVQAKLDRLFPLRRSSISTRIPWRRASMTILPFSGVASVGSP